MADRTAKNLDPRQQLARRKLQAARDELAAEQQQDPSHRRHRAHAPHSPARLSDLKPRIDASVVWHSILLMILVSLGVWCSAVSIYAPGTLITGRLVTLAVGCLTLFGASYASACYLGVVESTAYGTTEIDAAFVGDWRDWFWTMPTSFGMLAVAASIGYAVSQIAAWPVAPAVAVTSWLLYPVLEVSLLESGTLAAPLSRRVFATLVTRPIAWLVFYGLTSGLLVLTAALARAALRAPSYLPIGLSGVVLVMVLLIYGWMLGQLMHWLTIRDT